jgi:triphosphoribosyl-dephospho-CoA synthase
MKGSAPALLLPMVAADVAAAAQLACLLEVSAPKPGNVSPGHGFADVGYEDFLASAVAIGEPLRQAGSRPLGATVRAAIEATRRWTQSNTNLGIVLLLAPIAKAVLVPEPDRQPPASPADLPAMRRGVRAVLEAATVQDARDVYTAIRLARPGGLGRADDQDVSGEPTLPLAAIMRLAADRDGIAREYASGFETTFQAGVPALARARADGLSWDDAIVEAFLTLLAQHPDTHIARRAGTALAATVSGRAAAVLAAGGVRSAAGRRAVEEMDLAMRDAGNTANPGTTADLTAAAIFVVLLAGDVNRTWGTIGQ